MPGALPIDYVKQFWPQVRGTLDSCDVPVGQRPTALGFAVQHVIDAAKSLIDRTTAAQIVVEYAVPMAKIDPVKFG